MLSIVMMSKNEEKYIGKVFESLDLIRESIDTEIILLDTGSTDKTIDIAKNYNVNIYFEKWNNDFSYMRNKSISFAKNEWILILDADEVIVESDKLIDFFKSGKYKNYKSGIINIKNLINSTDISSSCNMIRLFKNNNNFEFTGIIHEQPKYQKPIYEEALLVCEHYGYMFEYEENIQKKNLRNLTLLNKQKEFDRYNPYVYFQLARTYLSLGKYADADYNINICKDLYSDISKSYYIYTTFFDIKYNLKEYINALNICCEYINFDNFNIDIFYRKGIACYKLKKYNESINSLKRYLYLYNNINLISQAKDILLPYDTNLSKNNALIIILKSYFYLQDYDNCLDIFEKNEDIRKDTFYEFIVCNYKHNNSKKIYIYFDSLKDDRYKEVFLKNLEKCIIKVFNSYFCEEIYKLFKNSSDKNYSTLNKYRLNKIYSSELEVILTTTDNKDYISEILHIYLLEKNNIPESILEYGEEKLKNIIKKLIKNYKSVKLLLYNLVINSENTTNINKIKLYKIICEILFYLEGFEDDKYINLFYYRLMYNYLYIKIIYKEFLNDDNKTYLLNHEELLSLEIISILKDKLKLCKYLKTLINKSNNYQKVINHLLNSLNRENNYSNELLNIKKEFIDLIQKNINSENTTYIKNLINQYEDIFSYDEFSLNTKGILSIYEKDFCYADKYFKKALSLNILDYDTIYNIAYLKEIKKEYYESINYYVLFKNLINNNSFDDDIDNKINYLKNIIQNKQK